MKLKSLLILVFAAFLVLSYVFTPQSAAKRSDSQTVAEETLVSETQYSLEDIDRCIQP
jgi:hypothetical protein